MARSANKLFVHSIPETHSNSLLKDQNDRPVKARFSNQYEKPCSYRIYFVLSAIFAIPNLGYAQTFSGNTVTNGPFSSGTQVFNNNSRFEAKEANSVTGGTQIFWHSTALNASDANAVSGGTQNFRHGSKLNIEASRGVSDGAQVFNNSGVAGVQPELNANAIDAIVGGTQTFEQGAVLNAKASRAINGGAQVFRHSSKLNITASNGLSGGEQLFNNSGVAGVQPELNANAIDSIVGGTQTFQEGAILNANATRAINGGTQKFVHGSKFNITASNGLSGGVQEFNGTSQLNASATDAISGGIQKFWDDTALNASADNAIVGGTQEFSHRSSLIVNGSGAINGGTQKFFEKSKLTLTSTNALSGGEQIFDGNDDKNLYSELNAQANNSVSGGTQTFLKKTVLNATAANAVSGGTQNFNLYSTLNATSNYAVNGGEQIFKDFAKLNANASFAISGGSQEFWDNAVLEASKADAISGGVQKFEHRSVLNASAGRSISGGEQNFFTNAELHANATETIIGGTQNFRNSSILTTNTSNAITGGSQRFDEVSQLNLNASSAISGGQQSFFTNATLNLSAPNAISGGIQDYSNSSVINANVRDAVNGLALTLKHDTTLNAHETYSVNNSTVLLLDKGTINFLAPDALAPTTRVIFSGGKLDLKNHDYKITPLQGTAGTIVSGTGTLLIDQIEDGVFGGSIVGSNRLFKTGTKQLLLSGDSSGFTGTTNLDAGSLVVNGKLGGNVNVASGSVLGGRGLIGSGANSLVTIASGGTLSPGNSIGTLTIDGNLAFNAGASYLVEVDPQSTASDLTHVTGTAKLSGGSVLHIGESGVYNPISSYRILTADGGVDGKFDNLTSDFAFLSPKLVYTGNNVDLQMYRNDIKFVEKATTFNEKATASALDSMTVGGSSLYNAMASLSNDEASIKNNLNSLSGEAYASAKGVLANDSRYIRSATYNRLEQAFNTSHSSLVTADELGGSEKGEASNNLERYAAWGYAYGDWSEQSDNSGAAKTKSTIGGFVSGIDAAIYENWRLGILAGYSRSTFKVNDRTSSGSSDNYTIGTYAGTEWLTPQGAVALRTGLAYTWHNLEMSRNVAFKGFRDNLSSDYDAGTFQIFGELGYKFNVTPRSIIEPYANLAYVHVSTDSFTEKGRNGAGLNVHSDTIDTTLFSLGVRASTQFDLGGIATTARADLGWRHAIGDDVPLSTANFIGSSPFTVAGTTIGKNTGLVEAGLDFNISKNTTFGISYHGQFGSGVKQNGLNANLSLRF